MSKQLEHVFSHQFKTDIWEVLPSNDRLLITTRDSEALQVSFSLFDLKKNEFLWEGIGFEESWWISVYDFSGDVIVFQTYNDTQDIEARSAFGFDVHTTEALWSIDDIKLNKALNGQLTVTPLSGEHDSFIINTKTGEEIASNDSVDSMISIAENRFPIHYESDNPHFKTLSSFVSTKLDLELVGSCDYLEVNDFFAIAVNSKTEKGYNLDLFVFSHEGVLLLQKSLDRELKGLASGTFFIVSQALIFVEGKRNLVFYRY